MYLSLLSYYTCHHYHYSLPLSAFILPPLPPPPLFPITLMHIYHIGGVRIVRIEKISPQSTKVSGLYINQKFHHTKKL